MAQGGLYSWGDCEQKGINIAKPGGSDTSRSLDKRDNLQHYVRLSFCKQHPMQFVAMNDGRISNPVVLEIDLEVAYWEGCRYADRNAVKNGAHVGESLADFDRLHLATTQARNHFDLPEEEQQYYQAEVLVPHHVPLRYITNLADFGLKIPAQNAATTASLRTPYTAMVTRECPTAFLFLIDQSISMNRTTTLYGDSVVLHYSPRTGRLSHSFGTLAQFLDGPSLLNCKDELQFGRLRVGHFALNRGEVLLLMSDALAQYVLMMYALQAGGSYAAQLQELEQRPSRLRDSLQQARALGNIYFWKDVLQPLLRSARSPQDFATHIDGLRRRGLLAHDDYSLAYAQR